MFYRSDLSHLNKGDYLAVPRNRRHDYRLPEACIVQVSRTTSAFLYYPHPQNSTIELKVRKKDGKIENKNSCLTTYAIEATPEIQEKNKSQMAAYERHVKAQAKFLQIIKTQGCDLSTESLEILGEAWDRCKESKLLNDSSS